ncbi:MAG TPA: ABC transporter ATP-binding protein [Ktedonobacterales bacterium]|nr:ABC transporter ATP-binding protein [Ktedonobacterales bacterium]
MSVALETTALGRRFGRHWALRDCTFALPAGRIAALVGPNGAGKTTLLQLAVGLLRPTSGEARVFGLSPITQPLEALPRIGFVAQDHPLYRGFTVAELLTVGRKLNPRWDQQSAVARLDKLGIPLNKRADRLSGGQQAQVALALALGKRPDLLLLDEPLASLDPLARRDLLRVLLDATMEHGLTVLLSSHIISDLERVCDYLVILSNARVALAGDIDEILRTHKRLVGPRTDPAAIASLHNVIDVSHTERQTTLLARLNGHVFGTDWQQQDVALEDVALAYLQQGRGQAMAEERWPMEGVEPGPKGAITHEEARR